MGMDKKELEALLTIPEEKMENLLFLAAKTKRETLGNVTYLRGLIELSNICRKNCLYCGIRCSNTNTPRYTLSDEEVFFAADYAFKNRYGSIAIQAGEQQSEPFISRIERLVDEIKERTGGALGITLSLGEQSRDTYRRWKEVGADRYLLRIETSNETLYHSLHPEDRNHRFADRIEALHNLKDLGYQLGCGVMIGLPGQSISDLANDLLFFKRLDIDMCGMGPFIEHADTHLKNPHLSLSARFDLTIRMIAILRILMPTINIAATTALQAIDPLGREKALRAGANVIMPNITPVNTRSAYKLYDNKPISEDCLDIQDKTLFERILAAGDEIGFDLQGNSKHFRDKQSV